MIVIDRRDCYNEFNQYRDVRHLGSYHFDFYGGEKGGGYNEI